MERKYKSLINSVKKVVQEVDPENWIDFAPDDEYDDYVFALVSRIANNNFELKSVKEVFPTISEIQCEELYGKLKNLTLED